MKKKGGLWVPLFGIVLVLGISIYAGVVYGIKAGLIYFLVFGIIVGFLIFFS